MMWELWLVIAVAVAVLVVICGALLIRKKQALPKSPIFSLAIALLVLGITFGDDPLIGTHSLERAWRCPSSTLLKTQEGSEFIINWLG
jgi:uncharacterized membrane protein YoaK (UPF0700 family)